jgi:hypothetical protein
LGTLKVPDFYMARNIFILMRANLLHLYIYIFIDSQNSLGFFNNFFFTIWKKISTMQMTQARHQQGFLSVIPPPPATRPPPGAEATAAASALTSPVVQTSALSSPGREGRLDSSNRCLLPNPAGASRLVFLSLAP